MAALVFPRPNAEVVASTAARRREVKVVLNIVGLDCEPKVHKKLTGER